MAASADTRVYEHVLEAARGQLVVNGSQAMTVRQVALAAGVDPGTVRYHFASREHLVEQAIGASVDAGGTRDQVLAGRVSGVGRRLASAVRALLAPDPMVNAAVASCLTDPTLLDHSIFGNIERDLIVPVCRQVARDEWERRAEFVLALVFGLAVVRYLDTGASSVLDADDGDALGRHVQRLLRAPLDANGAGGVPR